MLSVPVELRNSVLPQRPEVLTRCGSDGLSTVWQSSSFLEMFFQLPEGQNQERLGITVGQNQPKGHIGLERSPGPDVEGQEHQLTNSTHRVRSQTQKFPRAKRVRGTSELSGGAAWAGEPCPGAALF